MPAASGRLHCPEPHQVRSHAASTLLLDRNRNGSPGSECMVQKPILDKIWKLAEIEEAK
jgi:hypothetical protein